MLGYYHCCLVCRCHCPSVDTMISVQYFVLSDLYLRYYHNNAGAFWKQEASGSWSHGSWISNYLCNRWLSRISIMARCTWYNFTWIGLIFSGYSGFLHQYNWPSRNKWNIVESGVKHHNHNPVIEHLDLQNLTQLPSIYFFKGLIPVMDYFTLTNFQLLSMIIKSFYSKKKKTTSFNMKI